MPTTPFRPRTLAVSLAAVCALSAGAAFAASKDVVLALRSAPETLDPYNTNTTLTTAVTKSFYQGLFEFDKDLKVQPVLAESYTVSPDGLIYTFKLREGVKFHDGTPFNAEAVKANLDRVMNPENKLARFNQFNRIAKVEVAAPYSLRITLKEPFSSFINSLAHASAAIISPAALTKYGKDIGLNPVGTGPFVFDGWKQTDYVKGKKFDGYWKKGYPKVDSVTWKPVVENSTRAAMLQTGEADFIFSVPNEQVADLEKNPKLKVYSVDSIITRYLAMNTQQKPFDNAKVRQAVNHAINREALIKVAYNGYAKQTTSVVPQGIPYAQTYPAPKYDPAKARELLKEAGYPNGFETTLWGGYNDTTTNKVVQFLQQQLAQVGIKTSVLSLEPGQRTEMVQNVQDPQAAKVRLYYAGWSSSTGDADWALRPLFATEAWPPKLWNVAYYSNKVVDDAIASALKTTDPKEMTALYKTAQDQIMTDLPWAVLAVDKVIFATSKRLSGVWVQPDGNIYSETISVE